MRDLDYDETERVNTEYGEGPVHVREYTESQPVRYAVFDEREQVSDTAGPLNEEYIISFREGYNAACDHHDVERDSPDDEQLKDRLSGARFDL